MPLNSIPPTTTVSNFEEKLRAADGKCFIDVAFWGGVVPDNAKDLKPLLKRGVKGFKCFLLESGVSEFPCVTIEQAHKALLELQGTRGVLLFHAELDIPPAVTVIELSNFHEIFGLHENHSFRQLEVTVISTKLSLKVVLRLWKIMRFVKSSTCVGKLKYLVTSFISDQETPCDLWNKLKKKDCQ